MISFLRGKIINKGLNYAIVEVAGLGYQVFLSETLLNDFKKDSEIEIYTHHQVREEASDLYGFKTLDDLELFELLLTVSGVGPKSALGVLAIASAGDIKEAIIRGDANLLTKVAGIGKKTAERLVLELKTKILRIGGAIATLNSSSALLGGDEIDALNLVDSSITDSGERVKAALRKIGKN